MSQCNQNNKKTNGESGVSLSLFIGDTKSLIQCVWLAMETIVVAAQFVIPHCSSLFFWVADSPVTILVFLSVANVIANDIQSIQFQDIRIANDIQEPDFVTSNGGRRDPDHCHLLLLPCHPTCPLPPPLCHPMCCGGLWKANGKESACV